MRVLEERVQFQNRGMLEPRMDGDFLANSAHHPSIGHQRLVYHLDGDKRSRLPTLSTVNVGEASFAEKLEHLILLNYIEIAQRMSISCCEV